MIGKIEHVLVEFDAEGSLASTHESQGSDMGLYAGLLGWNATDEKLLESHQAVIVAGIEVEIKITKFEATHPNTYRITISNPEETHKLTAISTGGGMIEIINIDGIDINLRGDYYVTLIFAKSNLEEILNFLKINIEADFLQVQTGQDKSLIEVKAKHFLPLEIISELNKRFDIEMVKRIHPVLPVLSSKHIEIPFISSDDMLLYNKDKHLSLWELALHYESARSGLSHVCIFQKMENIVEIIQDSIFKGISGTEYSDRILGHQSGNFMKKMSEGAILDAGMLNQMILYVAALMEVKSSMGLIVAAPTAGSCAGLPGAVIGAADSMGYSKEAKVKSLLAAGLIGIFIAKDATFAAEVGGCQAECGSGSGMAAAALVTLASGSANQAVAAASLAIQNILGMICDPVANRVEVPCLGKNVLAASNALACANMALSNFDPVIPLDEAILTMDQVGRSLPRELRCTALGGLSITETAKEIEVSLNNKLIR
jgi:L-serine dehydratase